MKTVLKRGSTMVIRTGGKSMQFKGHRSNDFECNNRKVSPTFKEITQQIGLREADQGLRELEIEKLLKTSTHEVLATEISTHESAPYSFLHSIWLILCTKIYGFL